MGRRSRWASVTAGLLAVSLVGACTGRVDSGPEQTSGAVVALPTCSGVEGFRTPKTRVVVTEQGVLDTFAALGVADRVVARSGTASTVDPANAARFAAVPEIGELTPSTEGLLGARPDLVVQVRSFHLDAAQGGADVGTVRGTGAQVYPTRSACSSRMGLPPDDDLEGILTDIGNIGTLTGVPDRAAELTARLRAQRDDVVARVGDRPRVRGVQLSIVGGQLYATGGGLPAEMMRLAGIENLFPDPAQAYVPVSPEVITARDPQVIQIFTFPRDDVSAQLDYLRRTFPATVAVRTGRIGALESRKAGPASPATFAGLAETAHLVDPRAVPAPGG